MAPVALLAVTERSGLIEEYHPGAVAVVDGGGRVVAAHGDIDLPFYIRSSAKPFQAAVALAAGATLAPTELALACASHSGDPVHVATVLAILAKAGLGESDLGCPPARPFGPADRRAAAAGDTEASPKFHNCSGKHAAMLAACVASGWDLGTYLDADHPLQTRAGALVAEVTGVESGPPGIDGCGAPTWRTTTLGLARAFARLEVDDRFREIRAVMGRYPMLVSGENREDGLIGRWLGAAAKGGAAGCIGVAIGGHGIAAKAWSGSHAVAGVGAGLGLGRLGLLTETANRGLADVLEPPVLGRGNVVGRIRPAAVLESV